MNFFNKSTEFCENQQIKSEGGGRVLLISLTFFSFWPMSAADKNTRTVAADARDRPSR